MWEGNRNIDGMVVVDVHIRIVFYVFCYIFIPIKRHICARTFFDGNVLLNIVANTCFQYCLIVRFGRHSRNLCCRTKDQHEAIILYDINLSSSRIDNIHPES